MSDADDMANNPQMIALKQAAQSIAGAIWYLENDAENKAGVFAYGAQAQLVRLTGIYPNSFWVCIDDVASKIKGIDRLDLTDDMTFSYGDLQNMARKIDLDNDRAVSPHLYQDDESDTSDDDESDTPSE